MEVLDIFVILLYIVSIFILAFYSGKSKRLATDANEQYLAGNDITFTESICSIIATEVSALTFLGIPSFAYSKDFTFIHVYLGAILARFVIGFIFIPKIFRKGLTLYQIMKDRGGSVNGQRITSSMFFITKLFSIGVRLYAGSIIISVFFAINIYVAVTVICAVTYFYTLIGGLKAVVRTDIIQMGLFVLGGLVAHYIIPQIAEQNWSDMIVIAYKSNKMSIIDFSNPWPFIIGIFGGFVFDMATHGVDQDFIQRIIGNKKLKSAQLAISLSTLLSIMVAILFLSIGSLLWVHYQTSPLPEGIPSDKLFAHFITNYFPVGIRGLMVAGVLAATMSTLDSTINAMSSCLYNDILPNRKQYNLQFLYRVDTLVITVCLMLTAFLTSKSEGILVLGLKMASWTAGPLLCLFFTTVIVKEKYRINLNASTVILAYIFGLIGVYINSEVLRLEWLLNTYFGVGFAILAVYSEKFLRNSLGNRTK